MNWVHAFFGTGGNLTQDEIDEVINSIEVYDDDIRVYADDGYITSIEDCQADEFIWDIEWQTSDEPAVIRSCLLSTLPSTLINQLDREFGVSSRSKAKSKPLVIGSATRLPLPGARLSLK